MYANSLTMPKLQTRAGLHYNYYSSPDSLVYLVRGREYYKIGASTHLKKRMVELQIGSEYPLTLITTINTESPKRMERFLHIFFAVNKIRGEWFDLSETDIALFKCFSYL